jgi:hypothetical protein
MIENALFQLVTSATNVQAAVGVDKNGIAQAYWILAPQGAMLPFLVFSRVSTTDTYAMAGNTGHREGIFQISCYAASFLSSRNIAKQIRTLLENFTGTLPDGTVVKATYTDKDFDQKYEEGGKGFTFGAILHFKFWFVEA